MKLKTKAIIVLFQALSSLNGASRVVEIDGRKKVIEEPYALSPKVRWNAAKNRSILRRIVDVRDEVAMGYQKELRAFRAKLNPSDDPKENARKFQDEVERINGLLADLAEDEHDVEGLRKLSATGLNLKESPIPPSVIDELMPLIDGDPDFESEEKSK
ncbi:MAG: hypothetical protein QG602_1440 [Verrucomicrobiota bacterium]|nr:hypothetical protein [Verrucomicrobiota bacterium]